MQAPTAEVQTVLEIARSLLDRCGWCQRAEAVDASGHPRHPMDPRAVRWSASGAIYLASGFDGSAERRRVYQEAVTRLAAVIAAPPSAWNDTAGRRREEVLAALERAADACTPNVPAHPWPMPGAAPAGDP